MEFKFNHVNFNVSNLDESIAFYQNALGLEETHRMEGRRSKEHGGNFTIVYLWDKKSKFELELTYLESHPQKYDLGEGEFHLALETADYDEVLQKHKDMGIVCFENKDMGIYFIEDPDGYWIEIIPAK